MVAVEMVAVTALVIGEASRDLEYYEASDLGSRLNGRELCRDLPKL